MNDDLGKSFEQLINSFSYRYKGCLIVKENGGYVASKKWYATKQEAEAALDKSIEEFRNQIREQNPHLNKTNNHAKENL